jgi:RimJ/RimL family protein N-acetyltransferase
MKTKGGIYLRPLSYDDLDRVLAWHNSPELYETLAGHFRQVSRETEAEWLRRRLEAKDEVNLAICLSGADEHIGNIYLRHIDSIARNAELHIFIAPPGYRGKGYGSIAVQLMIEHAFKDLDLARLYLYVLASNSAAIAAYEKCGFVKEGLLRRQAFKKGAFEDMVVMGICRE